MSVHTTMDNVIYLKKSDVYFHAAFLDNELTIPCIDTYIFIGQDEKGYLFRDAQDASVILCYVEGQISCIYDHKSLSRWLLEEHSPKHAAITEYTYKLQ